MPSYGVSQDTIPGNLTVQGGFFITSTIDSLTAKAGGGQQTTGSSVIPVNAQFIRVTTTATGGDSITLPPSQLGDDMFVFNAGAASLNVFPATGEAIGTGSANAAFAVGIGKGAYFCVVTAGRWLPALSA